MSLAMSKDEREAFLAGLHVGVVSMNREGLGPLSAPIWYGYEDGEVIFAIGESSLKSPLMKIGDRLSLVVQNESAPYAYVSVEGPVVTREAANLDRDIRPMAIRYLGEKVGNQYADGTGDAGQLVIKMKPEKWLTVDYKKS